MNRASPSRCGSYFLLRSCPRGQIARALRLPRGMRGGDGASIGAVSVGVCPDSHSSSPLWASHTNERARSIACASGAFDICLPKLGWCLGFVSPRVIRVRLCGVRRVLEGHPPPTTMKWGSRGGGRQSVTREGRRAIVEIIAVSEVQLEDFDGIPRDVRANGSLVMRFMVPFRRTTDDNAFVGGSRETSWSGCTVDWGTRYRNYT